VKTWRAKPHGDDDGSGYLTAEQIAARLLAPGGDFLWIEAVGEGGAFAQDVAEVRSVLFAKHVQEMAAVYLKRGPGAPTWIGDLFMAVCRSEVAWALQVVRALVQEARSDEDLAYIGAGPLEDLLCNQGDRAIDEVEQLAAADSKFRFALGGVWPSTMGQALWARVTAALGAQERY
jgi:hypothetical protein